MIESRELPNRSELRSYLQDYNYDRFDIVGMYLSGELPNFIESEDDANELADEVLGTTLDEDMEEASNSPEAQASWDYQERQEQRKARLEERSHYTPGQLRAQFWGGVLAVVIVLVLLLN